jgi:hypothetical protein
MWGKNLSNGFPNWDNIKFGDMANFPPAIASQTYALESIGTLMCVRSTMKRRSQTGKMIIAVMGVGGALFILNGLSFYFSFYSPKSLPFWYYRTDKVVRTLEILFYLLTPSTIIINQISNLCMLEELKIVKDAIKCEDDEDDFDIKRLYIFRISVCVILLFPLLWGKGY